MPFLFWQYDTPDCSAAIRFCSINTQVNGVSLGVCLFVAAVIHCQKLHQIRPVEPVMSFVKIHNLRVSYGKLEAVRGISFEIPKGEVFGFIGPNGAGK